MQPWCAEGEMPTAANLTFTGDGNRVLVGIAMTNLYLGSVEMPSSLFR